ncbi:MAG: hypothetical protein VX353_00475 [Actinomycetota bacterium]
MAKSQDEQEVDDPQHTHFRWQFRDMLRSKKYDQEMTATLLLSYSKLSIGPVLSVSVADNSSQKSGSFYSVELPQLIATYIQHVLVWWLTLRGSQNLGESGVYGNLTDEEKIGGAWSPHFSFLVNGESTAIETKIQIRKILETGLSALRTGSQEFLRPLPNDPTKKQYISPENRGKRGKFDPGPVFGMSFDFLKTEAEVQKFFSE